MSILSSQTVLDEHALCSPCVACRLPLPILPKLAERGGQAWHCTRCDTIHHGILIEDVCAEVAANVRSVEPNSTLALRSCEIHVPRGEATKPLPVRDAVHCSLETLASRELDDAIARGVQLVVKSEGPPLLDSIKRHGASPYDASTEARFVEEYDESQLQVELLVESLEQGRSIELEAPASLTRDSLAQMSEDMDLFVRLGINPPERDYRGKHSLHVAMLAASIGANMGWDEKVLVDLGVGCLLHDIGMIRIPDGLYKNDRILDADEFGEIARHPIHTFDLIAEHCPDVSLASRMVAYQIHERCNGSGYPRNRQGFMIHQAAKVAAVADVYVALVSPRLHRPALMPYYAVEHLIYGVKNGQFDSSVVRALLKTISLFPIGSYLKLADQRVARVIRANLEHYGRPVVEIWSPDKLDQAPEVVDLSENSQIVIQGPVPRLEQVE
ncbi:MAG: HD domain-containing protein [Planctomycetes bacterium]|nr:HD domain-containing protein [Planctomycetota bacterium]